MSDAASPPPLVVTDLRRTYGDNVALAGVSLTVGPGELFGLLGPNGSGKTTLFRIAATLLAPSSLGSASVLGHDLPREADAARRRIGVVFQSASLDVHLTVGENLLHQGHLYGLRGRDLVARITAALERVGIAHRRGERAGSLSGGQRRRVELAKGLLHEPRLLLLDEPTNGLDPAARSDLWDHLAGLRRDGVASLVTTHMMEEAERCDRVAILDHGKIVALGSPHELRAALGGDVVTAEPAAGGDPDALRDRIEAALALPARAVGGVVHVRTGGEGATTVGRILESCGASVAAVTVGRPTLEDVFLEKTGRRFA